MKYYKLSYKCLKLRIKIQSKIATTQINVSIVNKGRDLESSPRAQKKRLEPGLSVSTNRQFFF